MGLAAIDNKNQDKGSVGAQDRCYNYADTMLPMRTDRPPYILLRVEPYYGTNDAPLPIYMKMHVHYTLDIEFVEHTHGLGHSFVPLAFDRLVATTSTSAFSVSNKYIRSTNAFDNQVHRMYGGRSGHFYYK